MRPILYLHGVGDDGTRLDWAENLDVDPNQVIAPNYADLLTQESPEGRSHEEPRATDADDQVRRRYRAEQARLHDQLRSLGSAAMWPDRQQGFGRVPKFIDAIAESLVIGLVYEQVRLYANQPQRRAAIRNRVLASIPDNPGELIVVGHSLGALVALDLISHPPPGLKVRLLVTAASALARREVPDEILQLRTDFPYDTVDAWINVYNPSDPVTRGIPIGPSFTQTIDVRVSGAIGDHALATCLADPGVSVVINEIAQGTDQPKHERLMDVVPLSRAEALRLTVSQLMIRMEDILPTHPGTTPAALAKFGEARRLTQESLWGSTPRGSAPDSDPSKTLNERASEADLPAILLRLATAEPLKKLNIHPPSTLSREARLLTAVDLGLPPTWIDLAHRCLEQVERGLPILRNPDEPISTESTHGHERTEELDIRDSLRGVLSSLTLAPRQASVRDGIIDLRPILSELLSRAVLAERLGLPKAGAEERDALSRMMVVLGEHRARIQDWTHSPATLNAQLRQHTETVGDGLTWLAKQGVGLLPRQSDPATSR